MRSESTGMHGKLRHKFFLSSMMKVTDGAFCSQRSRGCAMVQLGAYLAEPPAYGKEPYFLPADRKGCTEFLAGEIKRAKSVSKVLVCLNLATPRLEWGLEAADCFYRAGGDLLELNVHGGYEPYLRLGKLRAMVLPENRDELFRWVDAFTNLRIPLIVKFRESVVNDYMDVLKRLMDSSIFGVHFNIRDDETKKPDFNFVQKVKKNCPIFLLVSGYVRSAEDARALFEKGADVIGIAEPTVKTPDYIHKIAEELKARRKEPR